MEDRLKKWRLILGSQSDTSATVALDAAEQGMDAALEALYDSDRKGNLGASSPNINRWLGDIRKYFPASVVQVIQKDALERLQLKKILTEPELLEMLEPDVSLVATLISLSKVMPEKTKETARMVVRKVVEDLEKRIRNPLRQAIDGALKREGRNRRPKHNEIDWNRTIRANLKNYQPEYSTIIPQYLRGYGRKRHAMRHIILACDQSGSMASSVVYAGVYGSVIASLPSVTTSFIVFDTSVVDLSEQVHDPIELLFGVQLGGGTDIGKALAYVQKLIKTPSETMVLLITDLYEGGNPDEMLSRAAAIKESGAQLIVLLALDDKGSPSFNRNLAGALATMSIPSFFCTPDKFPSLIETALKKENLRNWVGA